MTKADGPFNFSFLAHYAFFLLPFSHTFCGIGKRVFLLALGTGGGKEEKKSVFFSAEKREGKERRRRRRKPHTKTKCLRESRGFSDFFSRLRPPYERPWREKHLRGQ